MSEKMWLLLLIFFLGAAEKPFAQTKGIPNGFIQVLPREIKWLPNPAVSGGYFAILLGDPSRSGSLVIRLRFPADARINPHTHPDARTYTVLEGEWAFGLRRKIRSGGAAEVSRRQYVSFACRCAAFSSHGSASSGCADRDVRSHENGFRPARS
jgi:hypothetical protein